MFFATNSQIIWRPVHDEIFSDFPKVVILDRKRLLNISSFSSTDQSPGLGQHLQPLRLIRQRSNLKVGFLPNETLRAFQRVLNNAKGESAPVDSIL